MIKSEIEALKRELNCRINEGADFNDVYELSVKLDKLILQYYKERGINRQLI
ncbi:aspartyl-phosphate phosphatase Spo0E family protein [Pseudoclostridium thermosuccinogenes]|nr:aspartyl-phosphate phosphatase Spo0E family protein [Pseudoclostridium thermosuccinogenes]